MDALRMSDSGWQAGVAGFQEFVLGMGSRDEWELAVCRMWTAYFDSIRDCSRVRGVCFRCRAVSGEVSGACDASHGDDGKVERGFSGCVVSQSDGGSGTGSEVVHGVVGSVASGLGCPSLSGGTKAAVEASEVGQCDAGVGSKCRAGFGGSNVDVGGSSCVGDRKDELNGCRGKWYEKNKKKRERRRCARDTVPVWRRSAGSTRFGDALSRGVDLSASGCAPCPSYGQAISDAEREAKETLARRRAVENRVASKLAELKLASLEDEKKCQEYADLKKSRMIQWTNEAVAKSQQSLDKCKSIDPASSSSQADIRAQAKELADVKAHFDQFARRVQEVVPNCDQLLSSCKPPGTATMDFLVAQAACSSNAGSFDPLDVTDDMDIKVQGYVRNRGYKAERFPVLEDEVLF